MPEQSITAKIVEWDDQKGFGFLQLEKGRVFLHRNDFSERYKRPAVGDVIRFNLGQDAKGRACAHNAVHANDGGRVTILILLILSGLLVLPSIALYRIEANLRWVGGYFLAMGLFSYFCCVIDKKRAKAQEWRVSENNLHITELLGGWPGSFLAQHQFHHKVSKLRYQIIFWFIVSMYQFAAFDSLQHWQLTKAALQQIQKADRKPEVIKRTPMILIITNQAVR